MNNLLNSRKDPYLQFYITRFRCCFLSVIRLLIANHGEFPTISAPNFSFVKTDWSGKESFEAIDLSQRYWSKKTS